MEVLMYFTAFYFSYEVMKIIMPHIESSWRMFAWDARQLKELKKESLVVGDDNTQVNIQVLGKRPETEIPMAYGLYVCINLVYSIYLIAMFLSFNPVCMLLCVGIKLWGKFISKFKPIKRWVMLDGAVSAVMLLATLYIVRYVI